MQTQHSFGLHLQAQRCEIFERSDYSCTFRSIGSTLLIGRHAGWVQNSTDIQC